MVKENGYEEDINSKIFRRITKSHSLPQSQQQTQATDIQEEDIRMSITQVEYAQHIYVSHKIRSLFYTENTVKTALQTKKTSGCRKLTQQVWQNLCLCKE